MLVDVDETRHHEAALKGHHLRAVRGQRSPYCGDATVLSDPDVEELRRACAFSADPSTPEKEFEAHRTSSRR
ncbi:hypothetical protein [Bradyrhizobium betae]|uniref:hypothetical protein n=1 Tax=Bradyrhizobium betae TaxID=244734 RepID=UPI001FE08E50|nr:hypothetical protein [Bradyrhizobium betae]